jgi:hypothetical protein
VEARLQLGIVRKMRIEKVVTSNCPGYRGRHESASDPDTERICPLEVGIYLWPPVLEALMAHGKCGRSTAFPRGFTGGLRPGHAVGLLARKLYSDGIEIDSMGATALAQTSAMSDRRKALFEGAFECPGAFTRVDIRVPWRAGPGMSWK